MFMRTAGTTFQSTLPAGGATVPPFHIRPGLRRFQSTLPAGGATAFVLWCGLRDWKHFNPRSPRGERPGAKRPRINKASNFNPRSPRGERRADLDNSNLLFKFQSTLPAGGATGIKIDAPQLSRMISIHAPRGGSDQRFVPRSGHSLLFQSTLPAGGATTFE